jgi:hypothetical protein
VQRIERVYIAGKDIAAAAAHYARVLEMSNAIGSPAAGRITRPMGGAGC